MVQRKFENESTKPLPLDDRTLAPWKQFADCLDVTVDTLNDYERKGIVKRAIRLRPGGPKKVTLGYIKAFIDKRARARDGKPTPRGFMKKGATDAA